MLLPPTSRSLTLWVCLVAAQDEKAREDVTQSLPSLQLVLKSEMSSEEMSSKLSLQKRCQTQRRRRPEGQATRQKQ